MSERIETSAGGHCQAVLGAKLAQRSGKSVGNYEWGGSRSLAASRRCAEPIDRVYYENLTVGVGHHRD